MSGAGGTAAARNAAQPADNPAATRGNPAGDRLAAIAAAALLAGVALLILWAPAPWFHDYAEWLFQARVLALKLSDPAAVSGYVLASYPVPSSLALLLLTMLAIALPLLWAGKLYLLGLLAGWAWLIRRWTLGRVPAGSRGAVALLLVAMFALSSFFWHGFINYQIGLLLLLGFLLHCDEDSPAWRQAGWGVLLFFCHAMVLLVWGCLTTAWALRRCALAADARSRWAALARHAGVLAPALLLVGWYVLGRLSHDFPSMTVQAVMGSWLESLLYKLGYPLMLGSFRNFLHPDGQAVFEQWPALYWLGLGCNAAAIVLLGLWGLEVLAQGWRRCGRLAARGSATLVALLSLIALAAVAPYHLHGLVNPSGRLILPIIAIALLLAAPASFRWWRRAALPVAVGGVLSLVGYAAMVQALPPGQIGHRMTFVAPGAPSGSVFEFNDAAYANTRFRYLNYRVLMLSERLEQAERGELSGLANVTSLIVGYRRPPATPAASASR